jgi:hypothetical protein
VQALLGCLPSMCGDPAIAPFALRALQPLAAPSAPPELQAAALRLTVEAWCLTRRGWQRAEAALNGCAPPTGPSPPLALRLGRAQLLRYCSAEIPCDLHVRSVCLASKRTCCCQQAAACTCAANEPALPCREVSAADPHKALELVVAVQEALQEGAGMRAGSPSSIGATLGSSPMVAALALDALGDLCAAGEVDWYTAWRVVARSHPTLPGTGTGAGSVPRTALAAAWVRLLAGGARDATTHPDKAAAVVDLLWSATEHPAPEVWSRACGVNHAQNAARSTRYGPPH